MQTIAVHHTRAQHVYDLWRHAGIDAKPLGLSGVAYQFSVPEAQAKTALDLLQDRRKPAIARALSSVLLGWLQQPKAGLFALGGLAVAFLPMLLPLGIGMILWSILAAQAERNVKQAKDVPQLDRAFVWAILLALTAIAGVLAYMILVVGVRL